MPETILVMVTANAEQFFKEMNKAGVATEKFSGKTKKAGGGLRQLRSGFVMVAAAIAGVVAGMKKMIDAYTQQETSERKLRAVLQNKIQDTTELAKAEQDLLKWSKERQKVTIFGDEKTNEALAMAATFPITATQAQELVTRAQDIASITGQDLIQTTIALGKASEGQVGALKRYGISLSAETERTKEFGSIMRDVDKFFRGASESIGQTTTGQLMRFKNVMSDTLEEMGAQLAPLALEIMPLIVDLIKQILPPLVQIISKVLPFVKKLLEVIMPPMMRIITVLMDALMPILDALMPVIISLAEIALPLIADLMEMIAPILQLIAPIIELLGTLLTPIVQLLTELVRVVMPILGPAIEYLALGLEQIAGFLTKVVQKLAEFLGLSRQITGPTEFGQGGTMLGPMKPREAPILPRAPAGAGDKGGKAAVPPELAALTAGTSLMEAPYVYREIGKAIDEVALATMSLSSITNEWVDTINSGLKVVAESFRGLFDDLLSGFFEPMKVKLDENASAFKTFWGSLVNGLVDLLQKVLVQGVILVGIGNLLNALFPGAGTLLFNLLNMSTGNLGAGGKVAKEGGFIERLTGALGSRQHGGSVFAGYPYIVGERGPELFSPGRSGRITNNQDLMSALAGMSSQQLAMAPAGAMQPVQINFKGTAAQALAAMVEIARTAPTQVRRQFGEQLLDMGDLETNR